MSWVGNATFKTCDKEFPFLFNNGEWMDEFHNDNKNGVIHLSL